MKTPRNYHSTALLLPDGTVAACGGGLCGRCVNGWAQEFGRPLDSDSIISCSLCPSQSHFDCEYFTPLALLADDGVTPLPRPTCSPPAPATVVNGGTFAITVTSDNPVASFSMVRTSEVTHGAKDLGSLRLTLRAR